MNKFYLIILLILVLFTACEEVIDVDLNEGKKQLTVDAVLNDLNEKQVVRLSKSGDYFDTSSVVPINSANISLIDEDGKRYDFSGANGSGEYFLEDSLPELKPGSVFTLQIKYDNDTYTAESIIKNVPPVDSITWSRESIPFGDVDSIWVAQFWSVDLEGIGDSYWVRSMRNGELRNDPGNITIAYDGSTGRGAKSDNIPFILPIRAAITPGGPGGPPSDAEFLETGESVGVHLYSITSEFAEYLTILETQLNNGGIFAQPPSNLPTNIINISDETKKALGWFAICKVSADSAVISWDKYNNRIKN